MLNCARLLASFWPWPITSRGPMETVADILGDEPHVDVLPPRIDPPRHTGQPEFPLPGIYFGMPEETYHSIHACSASGIKRLAVSSMDYWALSPLNEERPEDQPRQNGELTPKELGK